MLRAAATILVLALLASPALAAPQGAKPPVKPAAAPKPRLDFRLVEAAFKGDLTRLDAFLAQGLETEVKDAHGYTPLLWAAQQGHEAIVDALLAQGANMEARSAAGHSALLIAVAQGHAGIVRSLLRMGADPLARGPGKLSPYGYAKAHGQAEIMKLMDRSMAGERL